MIYTNLSQSILIFENDQLKKRLNETQMELSSIKLKYLSLEEDFLHSLKNSQGPSLQGTKIVYIGASSQQLKEYEAITKNYQVELITPKNNSYEAVCEAIKLADEVICPQDCKNQELCHSARSSCTEFNKPFREVANSSVLVLQQELDNIAIQQ